LYGVINFQSFVAGCQGNKWRQAIGDLCCLCYGCFVIIHNIHLYSPSNGSIKKKRKKNIHTYKNKQ